MKIILDKNKYFFIQIAIICLLVGIVCSFILPSKFYNDAEIIVNDPHNEIGLIGSYPFTMLFYKITFLQNLPYFLIALIQLPILFYVLYKIGIPKEFNFFNVKNTLVYIGFFLIALFICIPSKEFINFLYLSSIVFIFKQKKYSLNKSVFYSFVIFSIFGIFFRSYYLFIPLISLLMYLFTFVKIKNKTLNIILFSVFVSILMSFSYKLIVGEYISESTREMHNLERMGSQDAQSMIQSPIPTDSWYGETIGIFYGYISVNIPVNAIKHILKPQVLAFIVWQLFIFYLLYLRFQKCVINRGNLKYELWVFLFIFAYFVVQGLFEPDLGSSIRHKIGIFPLIYYAIYYEKINVKIQK
jgi:hypothetical protein